MHARKFKCKLLSSMQQSIKHQNNLILCERYHYDSVAQWYAGSIRYKYHYDSMLCTYDSMLCIHGSCSAIRHQYVAQCCVSGINMWLNAVYQALIWQWCASCINMASIICIMHQYCASWIKIMAQSYEPWLNAVASRLIDVHQASIIWLNAVHQASIWLNAMHQGINYSSMLSIMRHAIWLNTMHQL